jgi:HEAT repeat protein
MHQPPIDPARAQDPKQIPAVYAAKWPPDDSDVPGSPGGLPGAPGGYGGGSFDDGNFKKGAIKPIYVMVGLAMVVGAVGLGIFAIKGESEKMKVEDVAREKKTLFVLPKAEQLPKWREWAKQTEVPALQQEAFAELAWAKDQEGLTYIIKGLESPDARVVGTAAAALFEYGSPAADAARPALLKALKTADNSNKPQICWALAMLKESTAFDDVLTEYRVGHLAKVQRLDGNPVFDPDVLAAMVSIDKLAAYVGDQSDSVRQLVAVILSRTGDAKWTDALTKLVSDKVEIAREAAVGLGKIANEQSLRPLLSALDKADKDNRAKFLEALRDGIGAQGLLLALRSVNKQTYEREKFQTKQIFEMVKDLADPRGGDLLLAYINSSPRPHWKTEAATRMAEIGDVRGAPTLGWRMRQDTLKLYNDAEDPEYRRDDNERVVGARMLADLAIVYPEKKEELRQAAEEQTLFWATDYPQPHANALRFLAAVDSKKALPFIRKWADPKVPLPKEGQQPPFPEEWATAQSALRYLGWAKDPEGWGILEKQLMRKPAKLEITMEAMLQGGLAMLGMSLRAIGVGAAHGFAQWGDSKAYPTLIKFIEDAGNNEQARMEACFSLSWVANDEQMKEVAGKINALKGTDPKASYQRACYLESMIHRPVPGATGALVPLLSAEHPVEVRHHAARAMGFGGMSAELQKGLLDKMKDANTRTDAALALLIGGTPDMAQIALAQYNDAPPEAMEELKDVYNRSFGYWSDVNYNNGDVARWIKNAEAVAHVRVHDRLQDWPKIVLSRAIQGIEFDNGPHSITRVQFRMRLISDAKSSDPKKREEAVEILKFMKEKGPLMALRYEQGPVAELARKAFFEVMNPKLTDERIPEAIKQESASAPAQAGGGSAVVAPRK